MGGGSGRVGWGVSRRVDLGWGRGGGGTCPRGQALVNQRLPLPPLALPLTIPSP